MLPKFAKLIEYGNRFAGGNSFDDETDIPVVKDPDTGEGWISPLFTGVLSYAKDGFTSPLQTHRDTANKWKSYISEWQSSALGGDKEAMKKYVARYIRTMQNYKKKYGVYPKQRVIGHSRGGGGAIQFMRALHDTDKTLPQVDEFFGLDPYDTLDSGRRNVRRADGTPLAGKSIIVRPKNMSFIHADDVPGLPGKFKKNFGNLMVRFANRINPLDRKGSLSYAVPNTAHNSLSQLFGAAVKAHQLKTREKLREYFASTPEEEALEAVTSPVYGDFTAPIYEKAASMQKRADAFDDNAWKHRLMWGLGGGAAVSALLGADYLNRKAYLERSLKKDGIEPGSRDYEEGMEAWKKKQTRAIPIGVVSSLLLGIHGPYLSRGVSNLFSKKADYVGPRASTLARRAKELGLAGSEVIDEFTPEEIERKYNGIGNEKMAPWLRHALTRHWSYYTPAAFVHDLQFAKGGTEDDWRKANENLLTNLDILIEDNPNAGIVRRAVQHRLNRLAKYTMDKYSRKAFNFHEKAAMLLSEADKLKENEQ